MTEMPPETEAQPPKLGNHAGRPKGSYNYGWRSHLAREMKGKGISWTDELIESYQLYKQQLKESKPADPLLLQFWIAMMPYISLKMIEQETRAEKPKQWRKKKGVTPAALAQLTKLEGRKAS